MDLKVLAQKYLPIYLTIFYFSEIIGIVANVIVLGHCHVLQLR